MSLLRCAFVALALLSAESGAQGAVNSSININTPALLAPGDIIRLNVWRRPEFSGDFVIASDSGVTHPLMHDIKVAGLPMDVVENRLRSFLEKFDQNPAFVVSPLFRVFVGGEVRQPNVYTVPPGTSVTQVLALAGGATERGRLERVTLTRNQRARLFDITFPESDAAVTDVRSGDQIVIARRRNLFAEVIAPSSSILAAAAALVNLVLR